MDFINIAYAATDTQEPSALGFLLPIFILVLMYFVLIRPQSKKLKEHKSIVGNIAKQLLKRETIDYRFIKKHFPCELEDSVIYGKEVGILGVG